MKAHDYPWTCPYCQKMQLFSHCMRAAEAETNTTSKFGSIRWLISTFGCLNPTCKELSVRVDAFNFKTVVNKQIKDQTIGQWKLRPDTHSLPQPECIPETLKADYYEAGKILHLSPKSAATLARRCLQGMIRDFTHIAEGTLDAEIRKLSKLVSDGSAPKGVLPEHIEAIDAIRKIGNIGAHMEKDINLIIEIEPGEAEELLKLIELLFEEWYVAREQRNARLAGIKAIADNKKAAQLAPPKNP